MNRQQRLLLRPLLICNLQVKVKLPLFQKLPSIYLMNPDGPNFAFLAQIDHLIHLLKIDGSGELVLKSVNALDLAWLPDGSDGYT